MYLSSALSLKSRHNHVLNIKFQFEKIIQQPSSINLKVSKTYFIYTHFKIDDALNIFLFVTVYKNSKVLFLQGEIFNSFFCSHSTANFSSS